MLGESYQICECLKSEASFLHLALKMLETSRGTSEVECLNLQGQRQRLRLSKGVN